VACGGEVAIELEVRSCSQNVYCQLYGELSHLEGHSISGYPTKHLPVY
jgi:hypothetical protein